MNSFKNAKTQFIDVNGNAMAYRLIGDESAVPLLCLQHFTGTMDGWDPAIMDELGKSRRVIIFAIILASVNRKALRQTL